MPALIFDLDGTLIDTVYAHVFSWQRALAEAGMAIDGWRIHRRIGMSGGLFTRAVAREIESGVCVGGGATMRPDQPILVVSILIRVWNLVSRLKRWAAGSFIFCNANVFRQIGGFDEELFVSEEIEFSNRLNAFARSRNRKVTIISGFPLVTSVRKFHLYSGFEHTRFLIKAALRPGAILRQREDCPIWYDGRR